MKKSKASIISGSLTCLLASLSTGSALAEGWSLVPYIGGSIMDDQNGVFAGTENINDGSASVALDSGFVAGLGLRYDYADSPWIAEFAWEYRSNDSATSPAAGDVLPGGNYASNTFFLNGRYVFANSRSWRPWIGAGLSYVQEIDLDSETANTERSFSSSGDVGFQVMAGIDYDVSDKFYLTSELRYSSLSGVDLEEEGGDGRLNDIDYNPITVGLGVGYRF